MPIYCPHCDNELSHLDASGVRDVNGTMHLEENAGEVHASEFEETDIDDARDFDYECPDCDRTLTLDELVVRNDDDEGDDDDEDNDNETTVRCEEPTAVKNTATDPSVFEKDGDRARAAATSAAEMFRRCPRCDATFGIDAFTPTMAVFNIEGRSRTSFQLQYACSCGHMSTPETSRRLTEGRNTCQ